MSDSLACLVAASLAATLPTAGCKSTRPGGPGGFGLSAQLAVEVCYPPGVVAYLKRLRCPDGSRAREVERVSLGSRTSTDKSDPRLLEQLDPGHALKPGEPDLHIVDRFTLSCPSGDRLVYIDMYHCLQGPPVQAPEGLVLE
jgi:hypothetical protein